MSDIDALKERLDSMDKLFETQISHEKARLDELRKAHTQFSQDLREWATQFKRDVKEDINSLRLELTKTFNDGLKSMRDEAQNSHKDLANVLAKCKEMEEDRVVRVFNQINELVEEINETKLKLEGVSAFQRWSVRILGILFAGLGVLVGFSR